MTKDEALKLALEALEEAHYKIEHKQDAKKREKAITAIKEALMSGTDGAQPEHGWTSERIAGIARLKEAQDKKLAQPEQEPMALIYDPITGSITPPQRTWVGLTDEEKADLFASTAPYYNEVDYAQAIEAKLKEKNT